MDNLLVIDGDQDTATVLEKHLSKDRYRIHLEPSAQNVVAHMGELKDFNLVFYDSDFNRSSEFFLKLKENYPLLPVIVMGNDDDFKVAVWWMKQGACDYLLKPLTREEISNSVNDALQSKHAFISSQKTASGTPEYGLFESDHFISGKSQVFDRLMEQTAIVAPTDYSVIIYGESGSGKEAIAREIHRKSHRKNFPFIAIDCGTLSKELAASELFGHEKGSFTGAIIQKTGSFELANKGTLFLDEVANLPYEVQVSLLRVIQERKMRRIGGTCDIPLDVRIIIASNENLQEAARKGQFREDLFHRFNEFTITVPPVRQRKADINLFAAYFLREANQELNKKIPGFSPEVLEAFENYAWPGNLRELRNVVRRAVLLGENSLQIDAACLPLEIKEASSLVDEKIQPAFSLSDPLSPNSLADIKALSSGNTLKSAVVDMEYQLILKTLAKCNFNKSKAAKMLKIDRRTLYNKMNQYRNLQNEKKK